MAKQRRATGKDGNDYTLFYGGYFSNFYPCEKLEIDGIKYFCTEQYFMHRKAVTFKDPTSASAILKTTKPAVMKAFGRKVHNFDPKKWAIESTAAMIEANVHKYLQNDNLRKELEKTAGSTIVECSPRDRLWGIGMGVSNPLATDKTKWRGKNKLGKVLEQIRECLLSKQWTDAEDLISIVKSNVQM